MLLSANSVPIQTLLFSFSAMNWWDKMEKQEWKAISKHNPANSLKCALQMSLNLDQRYLGGKKNTHTHKLLFKMQFSS